MHSPLKTSLTLLLLVVFATATQAAGFTGKPILLSAEGGETSAVWVAYENGDLLRCTPKDTQCNPMSGIPAFASPVSLSAVPNDAAAWVGWSDGSLTYCTASKACTQVLLPGGP